jgi:hypothetical protein
MRSFESDEERFFSEPPGAGDEADTSSDALASPADVLSRVPSEAESERRARLRRVVVGVLCASVGVLLAGTLVRRRAQLAGVAEGPNPKTAVSAVSATAAGTSVLTSAPSSVPPPSSAFVTPPATSASAATPGDAPREDPENALRLARTLLESGHVREGVAAARSAVEANPAEAEPYILLAAGLQDLGNWSEARSVFAECERKARRGPNESCRYFAGKEPKSD